ncbi:Serine/threonine-protein kinase ulk2 [Irineochytrium annulatum]|nr:Serine/threonine-protein kinase ulk2 [Irineochytrium annulatum]
MAANPPHAPSGAHHHPAAAPAATVLTTAVGDFAVSEEIGRGSFATVYMGRRVPSSREVDKGGASQNGLRLVAIKTVNREKLNRKLAENLETEIRILKGIHHDNIVALLDIVKTDKHIHLVMEYCSMGDLSLYIKRKGSFPSSANHGVGAGSNPQGGSSADPVINSIVPLPQPITDPNVNPLAAPWGGLNEVVVRHYLRQLAFAIEFLRSQSLIHRDLKPQNLLLNPPPPNSPPVQIPSSFRNGRTHTVPALPTLKLADFGFARALPQQSLASTLCGSPLYMAPEILRGDRYDAKADLWSLGAILYEMLTGRPPFKAQNHIDLLRRIDRGEGWIRFPGEEEGTAARRSVMVTNASPRPGTSVGSAGNSPANFAVGSLGASPRFPSMVQNAIPIAEDLKDLIRRLLKRNPVERMSFEEFFMHPCVANYAHQHAITGRSILEATVGEEEIVFSKNKSVAGGSGGSTDPSRLGAGVGGREEMARDQDPHRPSRLVDQQPQQHHPLPDQQMQYHPTTPTTPSHTTPSVPFPNTERRRSSSVASSLPHHAHPLSHTHHHTNDPPLSTPVTPSTPQSLPEPPFAIYDVNPADLFVGLSDGPTHVAASSMTTPVMPVSDSAPAAVGAGGRFHEEEDVRTVTASTAGGLSAGARRASMMVMMMMGGGHGGGPGSQQQQQREHQQHVNDRDPLSSLSSLGSLELSEEGDDGNEGIVKVVRRNNGGNGGAEAGDAASGGDGGLREEGAAAGNTGAAERYAGDLTGPAQAGSVTDHAQRQRAGGVAKENVVVPIAPKGNNGLLAVGHGLMRPANKASFEEYVVVEKKVVEVNWLADEVAASASASGSGGSSDLEGHGGGKRDRNGNGEHSPAQKGQQYPAPQQHQPLLSLQYQQQPSPALSTDSPGIKAGVASSLRPGSGEREREREKGAIAVPGRHLSPGPGMMHSSSSSSSSGSGGGGVVFGGSPGVVLFGGSPSTPPSPKMLGGREIGKGRVFGSLRDSTHNFLNTNPTHQAGSQGSLNALYMHNLNDENFHSNQQQVQQQQNQIQQQQMQIQHQQQILNQQQQGSLLSQFTYPSEDSSTLLTTLNLCAIRGHAVNILADDRYRDLVTAASSQPQDIVMDGLPDDDDEQRAGARQRYQSRSVIDGTPAWDPIVAEEAVNLYLTALGLYQLGIEAAKAVWGRMQGSASGIGAGLVVGRSGAKVDVGSLSAAVQWIRERFNECLERAVEVRAVVGEDGGSVTGRPVEKIVYDRALEIAKNAAGAEHASDWNVAEAGYTQAVLLLEAVLYATPAPGQSMDEHPLNIAESDRAVIERFVASLGVRLGRVREAKDGNALGVGGGGVEF